MTPYFSRDNIEIYYGDCRDILGGITVPEDAGWIIDPPWDAHVFLPTGTRKLVFCDGWRQRDVYAYYGAPLWIFVWDCVSSWFTKNRPLRRAKFCFWYGNISEYLFDGAHIYDGPRKPKVVTNSRGTYRFVPDVRGKHLADIYSYPITRSHKDGPSHNKPVRWMGALINCCLSNASIIVDPFMGSGAAAAACRETGIKYIGVEHSIEVLKTAIKNLEKPKQASIFSNR